MLLLVVLVLDEVLVEVDELVLVEEVELDVLVLVVVDVEELVDVVSQPVHVLLH